MVFGGKFAQYDITYDSFTAILTVRDSVTGRDGTDAVTSAESLAFADGIRSVAALIPQPNTVPVAIGGSAGGSEDTTINGATSATDANGDALTYLVAAQPSKGSVAMNASGSYAYTPNLNANGADSFTFRASDGTAQSNTATISISIAPVNDAPTGTFGASGSAQVGQRLTSQSTLADADGLGTLAYQWLKNGAAISGAITFSYDLTTADLGATVAVWVSYTDGGGTAETITSAATAPVTGTSTITGTPGADRLAGTAAAEQIFGLAGSDTIEGGGGNDTIDGGDGTDTAAYASVRSAYQVSKSGGVWRVLASAGNEGRDELTYVEQLKFGNVSVALDVGANEAAGQTALLLGAVLPGRLVFDPSKQPLLGSVIGLFDAGYSLRDLSGALLRLPVWDVLTGRAAPTDRDIANYLLANVNGRPPAGSELDAATRALDTESFQGDWLASLAASAANQVHIGLAGLADTGFEVVLPLG